MLLQACKGAGVQRGRQAGRQAGRVRRGHGAQTDASLCRGEDGGQEFAWNRAGGVPQVESQLLRRPCAAIPPARAHTPWPPRAQRRCAGCGRGRHSPGCSDARAPAAGARRRANGLGLAGWGSCVWRRDSPPVSSLKCATVECARKVSLCSPLAKRALVCLHVPRPVVSVDTLTCCRKHPGCCHT